MTRVALALIATKQSNPEQANDDGETALIIATRLKMSSVILSINNAIKAIYDAKDAIYDAENPGHALPAAGGKTKNKKKKKKNRKTKKR